MKKRLMAITLCLAMALSLGAGLTLTEEKAEISFPLEEPITMTMFAITNNIELPDNIAFQKLEEMTNVKWEVQSTMGVDLAEKRNLLLASNQYPDVFFKAGLDRPTLDKYGAQGTFIDLTDLIAQYAPNLTKIMNERPAVKDAISSENGAIYSLPEVDLPSPAIPVYFFNQKWLNNLGLEEPTNLDELYTVLKAFKEGDPNGNGEADEIPWTVSVNATQVYLLLPYFGINFDPGTWTCITKQETLEYVPFMPEFKEFIAYITKLYSEGILDKNAFTAQLSQQQALGVQGDILGSFFDAGAFLTVGRERDRDFIILTPFEEGVYPIGSGASAGTMAITDACEYPEIAVAWADLLYDEAGGRLAWLGIEGMSYQINDDGSWEWIMGDYADINDVRQNYTIQGAAVHPSVLPELWFAGMTDPNEKYLTDERNRIVELGAEPRPVLYISETDNKTLTTVKADVDPYIVQYIAQVATGELDLEASWDEFQSILNNMGAQQLKDIYQAAYEKTK